MNNKKNELLLEENPNRFSLFPIQHQDIFSFYEKHLDAFWRTQEVDLSGDIKDWERLTGNEQFFLKNILAFFSQADGIVNENIAENFYREVQYPEAKFFYGFQIMMENIHSHMYALLIDTYIKNQKEKLDCFNAIENMPIVKKKAEWALNWVKSNSFAERLIAFTAVEGIFFSGKKVVATA